MTDAAGPEGEVVMPVALPAAARPRRIPRALVPVLIVLAAAACGGTPAPQSFAPRESRTPFRVMADSTLTLAARAVHAADTATTQVRLVLADTAGSRLAPTLVLVRAATVSATTNANGAIMQGDRLREVLGAPEDRMAEGYQRYWDTGRRHLDVARTRASQATAATDSAIACGAAACARLMAREAKIHADAAAGAAHEAESVVRIAASYVN